MFLSCNRETSIKFYLPKNSVKTHYFTENGPVEQEKRDKYLDLVASAVILQNTVDMSLVIQAPSAEGYPTQFLL